MQNLLEQRWPPALRVPALLAPAHLVVLVVSGIYLLRRQRKSRLANAKLLSRYDSSVVLPPHVTSYVPYLGSALEMGRGIRKFIAKYTRKFHGQPVFTANIAGNHSLFIGDPDHVTLVYKYAKYLDDFALQKQFTHNVLGVTSAKDEKEIFSDLAKEANKQYHHYLFTDAELNKTVMEAQGIFQDILARMVDESGTKPHRLDLYRFVRDCVFKASVAPLISRHLATDEASALYEAFDRGVPLMFGEAPSFLFKDAADARQSLIGLISDDQFVEGGSDLMKARTGLNFSRNNFIRSALGLLFASVGNSIPAVFWCIYNICKDPVAYEAVRAEVDGVLRSRKQNSSHGDARPVSFTLGELDQMVLLGSCFREALRLYHGAFTTREAREDFVFDPKKPGGRKYLIEKGTRVMAFAAVIHHDEEVFEDAESYRYDRFAPVEGANGTLQERTFCKKDGRRVAKPLVAFGGGAHLCPGRRFISYETQAFVAVLITMFDMRLVREHGDIAPSIDYSTQGVGVSHPNRDIKVEFRHLNR
jgi:hypothetical protein